MKYLIIFITLTLFFYKKENSLEKNDNFIKIEKGKLIACDDTIVINNDFYICKTEVSVYEFSKFVEATQYVTYAEKNPNIFIAQLGKLPKSDICWKYDNRGLIIDSSEYKKYAVRYITWEDAIAYCKWKTLSTGVIYRLPTKSEWIYAAKGGSISKDYTFSGSNHISEVCHWKSYDQSKNVRFSIKSKKPNEIGIYDMTGGVAEWCLGYEDNKLKEEDHPYYKYFTYMAGGANSYWESKRLQTCNFEKTWIKVCNGSSGFRVVKESN